MGTLTLRAECQSAWMSKITNHGLTRSATGCSIAVHIWQSKRQRVNNVVDQQLPATVLSTHRSEELLGAFQSLVNVSEDWYGHPLYKVRQICMTSLKIFQFSVQRHCKHQHQQYSKVSPFDNNEV